MFLVSSREESSALLDRQKDLEQEVHFDYESRGAFNVGRYSVLSWRKSNCLYSEKDFIFRDNERGDVALLQGYAWESAVISGPLNAEGIFRLLVQHKYNVQETRTAINGEYSFVLIQKEGLLAFNDRLGIENIYLDIRGDRLFITNRMSLYAACNKTDYDYSSLLYLPVLGFRFAEKTLYRSLSVLPQGAYLETHNGKIVVCTDPYFFLDSAPDKNLLLSGLEECIAYLENIFRDKETVNLGITGGMDSRLVLALLLNTGLKDKLQLFTNGFPENPDVIVGKQIAKELGLKHTNNIPLPRVSQKHDAQSIIKNLAIHSYQNEGMFGAWDLKAYPKSGNKMVLTGMVGELLKGYCKSPYNYSSIPLAHDFIPKQGLLDPLDLLNRHTKSVVDEELRERVNFYLSSGCDYNDVPDIFYLKERIPNWLGAARRVDSYSDQGINPLNSSKLIQYSFSLNAQQRQSCLVHYQSLKELCEPLLAVPFAGQRWDRELRNYGADESIFHKPVLLDSSPATSKPWQFTINDNSNLRNRIAILVNALDSPLKDYLSHQKLISVVETKQMSVKELVSVYGYLTVLFKSSDFVLPQRLGLTDASLASKEISPLNQNTEFLRLNGGEDLVLKYSFKRSVGRARVMLIRHGLKLLFMIKSRLGKFVRRSPMLTLVWENYKSKR